MPTVLHVVGARPNFMKIAPVMAALRAYPSVEQRLVHTGQHHDPQMAGVFIEELGLPQPDVDLAAGGGSHARQTAEIMIRFEAVLTAAAPDLVVVVGDVNSTLAAALVAAKAGVPVAHVEAGLRSGDRSMPEEINRIVTDHLSSILLAPSAAAAHNLRREGVADRAIAVVGNVMVDTLLQHRDTAPWSAVREALALADRGYAVLTLHRPANVDDPARLRVLVDRIAEVAARLPVIWPIHPRTARRLAEHRVAADVPGLRRIDPLGYTAFLALVDHARAVITDSGGIQAETTVLDVPCFTLRDNTEWPETVASGTNTLVMSDGRGLAAALDDRRHPGDRPRAVPPLWDGRAGGRAADVLAEALGAGAPPSTPGVTCDTPAGGPACSS
jgi:UDP-N-acetylglucosamine 2-epimerase (non-hydrolysing)